MMILIGPWQLVSALFVVSFRVVGYTITCAGQAAWYPLHGNRAKVGDALGELGRGVTDAISEAFTQQR